MATPLKLIAEPRLSMGRGPNRQVRVKGLIPGVIYGKSVKSENIQFSARDITKLLKHAASENVLVDVQIGAGKPLMALLQEVQHHPVTRRVIHLDLHAVAEDEMLRAHVPIEPFGEPFGVKNGGGILDQSLRSLDLECLPRLLPEVIRVDVSGIKLGESLHVRDLVLPEGVTPQVEGALTVFVVHPPTVAAETVPAVAEAAKQPEAIKEKKPDAAAPAAADKKAPAKK